MFKCNFSQQEYQIKKQEYRNYKKRVWEETNKQPLSQLENWMKRGRTKESFHLDHIISIRYGFINKIDPEIIGNIRNLRFISRVENLKKSDFFEKESWEVMEYLINEGILQ